MLDETIKITVDLGDHSENIYIRKGEEKQARRLAKEFCQRFNFDRNI